MPFVPRIVLCLALTPLLPAASRAEPAPEAVRPAIPELIRALADPDRADWARDNLRDRGRDAVPTLLEHLRADENPAIRAGCAFVLGKMRTREAVPTLRKALDDEHAEVRRMAAVAFAELALPETLPGLARIADDPDEGVRAAAVRALGEIVHPESTRLLVRKLLDSDERVRTYAVVGLDRLREADLAGVLLTVAERGATPGERALAVSALGNLEKVPGAIDRMVAWLDDEEVMVRRAAINTLHRVSRKGFGYNYRASKEKRRAAVAQWRRWGAGQKRFPHGAIEAVTPRRYVLGFDLPKALPTRQSIAPPWPIEPELWPVLCLELPDDVIDDRLRDGFAEGARLALFGRWDAARMALSEVVDIDRKIAPAHLNLAIVYAAMGKKGIGREHLEYAARLAPALPEVACTRAWWLATEDGDWDVAFAALEAVPEPGRGAVAEAVRGAVCYRLEKYADAARSFERAIERGGVPTVELRPAAALAHWRAGQTDIADRWFGRLMTEGLGDPVRLLLYRAEAALRTGDAGIAEERLLALGFLKGHPEPAAMHRMLADLYLRRGAWAQAQTHVEGVLKASPDDAQGLWMKAWLHLAGEPSMLNPERALHYAERAVKADAESAGAAGVWLLAKAVVEGRGAVRMEAERLRERFPDDGFVKAVLVNDQ